MARCRFQSVELAYERLGSGPELLFLHGLGASGQQGADLLAPVEGLTLTTYDAPGHGESGDLESSYSFGVMTDGARALRAHLGLEGVILVGLSMGAAVATRLALADRARVRGLVLIRPAWLDTPSPPNLEVIARLGRWIETEGVDAARAHLEADPFYREQRRSHPHSAASLAGVLDRPDAAVRGRVLYEMVEDAPFATLEELDSLDLPSLVVETEEDALHPSAVARQIADRLRRSSLRKTPPRYLEPGQHAEVVRRLVAEFVRDIQEVESA